jgi:hypothetical protein
LVEFMQQGTTITSKVYREKLKEWVGPFRRKGVECWHTVYWKYSSVTMRFHIQLLALEHCWRISTERGLNTLLTAPISFRTAATYFPTWRLDPDHSAPTTSRSWLKVSRSGWVHSRQTTLTKAYKNLFPDTKTSLFPVVTTLRNS